MGAESARITTADFVTPPEFRGLHLSRSEAGCVGGLRLELVPRGNGAGFGPCYQQVPLRVLPPFQLANNRPALVYVLNPTAGLLDGDGQLIRLTVRAGARAVVVGQSATRIHPCPNGFATQQWAVRVEANAALTVLPGPSIPFEGCRYFQRVRVELEAGADFVWGDVGYAGRYERGASSERFRFASLVQDFQVRREGKLVFRDRFSWSGPWDRATAAWHVGDGLAWGSLFVTGSPGASADSDVARFRTAFGDTCFRWTGSPEQVTAGVVEKAQRVAPQSCSSTPEAGWGFDDELAPVHWFSTGCANASGGTRRLGSGQ